MPGAGCRVRGARGQARVRFVPVRCRFGKRGNAHGVWFCPEMQVGGVCGLSDFVHGTLLKLLVCEQVDLFYSLGLNGTLH